MNKVILVGRLARDPELRATQSGTAVVSFSVACDRRFTKEGERSTDFINCVGWGKTAEFISRYFSKGMRIGLSGRIETRSWEDDKGNKRYATEVVAEEVEFGQARSKSDSPNAEQASSPNPAVLSASGAERQSGKNFDYTSPAAGGVGEGSSQALAAPNAELDGFMPVEDSDLPF